MAQTVYCLLVGIDAYGPPVHPPLQGCRNDARALEQFLVGRFGENVHLVVLTDEQATRAAVIDGFRSHLARASTGDVALFAYSGHGSQERPPSEFAYADASGKLQNLLLFDAGHEVAGQFVWPLADKELGLLLDEVGKGGAHVLAILDCCHSGDGTRDASVNVRQWQPSVARAATPQAQAAIARLAGPRPIGDFLPGTLERVQTSPAPGHIALSACQPTELAKELLIAGEHRGAFSATLIEVLETGAGRGDYRSVVAAVRSRLERSVQQQRPSLHPLDAGSLADSMFFAGRIEPTTPAFLVTRSATGWSVDAGLVHGLRAPSAGEEFRLTCVDADGAACGQVRVVAVEAGRAAVEPLDWHPADTVYRAVISWVPQPAATVSFDAGLGPAAEQAYTSARAALTSIGPGGAPSPYVTEQISGSTPAALALRVAFEMSGPAGPCLRVLRADGSPAIRSTASAVSLDDPARAAMVLVHQLEHLARWEQLRALGNHRSALRDAVTLAIYPANTGETTLPADRRPLDGGDEYTVAYRDREAPTVFMHLENTSSRDLYVAVLDLTEDFEITVLFEAAMLAAGAEVNISAEGGPMRLTLPDGVDPVAGARTRDWLKVVVSETPFDATCLEIAAVGASASLAGAPTRSVDAPPGNLLEQLAPRAANRAVRPVAVPKPEVRGADWCARTVTLVVEVPEAQRVAKDGTAPGVAVMPVQLIALPAACGDCLVLEYGSGATRHRLLIDGGLGSTYEVGLGAHLSALPAGPPFDVVVVTHVDRDHIDGVVRALRDQQLQAGDIWFNGRDEIDELLNGATRGVRQGDDLDALIPPDRRNRAFAGRAIYVPSTGPVSVELPGEARCTLLSPSPPRLQRLLDRWPERRGAVEDLTEALADEPTRGAGEFGQDGSVANGSSIAFLFEAGPTALLLTGDAFAAELETTISQLLAQRGAPKLRVDLFKLSHHGSRQNMTDALLELIDPAAILVCTDGSKFHHPDEDALAKIRAHYPRVPIYFTDDNAHIRQRAATVGATPPAALPWKVEFGPVG